MRDEQVALLDSAAAWPICRKELRDNLGLVGRDSLERVILSTRFGRIRGYLDRCRITLVSEFGSELSIDGTVVFSEEWEGPNVIGWNGCLERIRFALDPSLDMIF